MTRTIHDLEIKNMLRLSNEAMDRSYAPYSGFRVGACLKGASGAYYLGSNIENCSFGATVCAEQVAMHKAVYDGERSFDALAVVCSGPDIVVPCGICRQVYVEFADPEMPVICANKSGKYQIFSLGELVPQAFTPEMIK